MCFAAEMVSDDASLVTGGTTVDKSIFAALLNLKSPVGVIAIVTVSFFLFAAFIVVCRDKMCVRRRRRAKSSPVRAKQSTGEGQQIKQPQTMKRTNGELRSPGASRSSPFHASQQRHLTPHDYRNYVYPQYMASMRPYADDDSTSSDSSSCRRHYHDYYYDNKRRKRKALQPPVQHHQTVQQQSNPVYLSPDVLRVFDAQFHDNPYVSCGNQRLMLLDNSCRVHDVTHRNVRRHRHSSSSNSKSRAKKRHQANAEMQDCQPVPPNIDSNQQTDAGDVVVLPIPPVTDSLPAVSNTDTNEQLNNAS
jgi:hypothetical protein